MYKHIRILSFTLSDRSANRNNILFKTIEEQDADIICIYNLSSNESNDTLNIFKYLDGVLFENQMNISLFFRKNMFELFTYDHMYNKIVLKLRGKVNLLSLWCLDFNKYSFDYISKLLDKCIDEYEIIIGNIKSHNEYKSIKMLLDKNQFINSTKNSTNNTTIVLVGTVKHQTERTHDNIFVKGLIPIASDIICDGMWKLRSTHKSLPVICALSLNKTKIK